MNIQLCIQYDGGSRSSYLLRKDNVIIRQWYQDIFLEPLNGLNIITSLSKISRNYRGLVPTSSGLLFIDLDNKIYIGAVSEVGANLHNVYPYSIATDNEVYAKCVDLINRGILYVQSSLSHTAWSKSAQKLATMHDLQFARLQTDDVTRVFTVKPPGWVVRESHNLGYLFDSLQEGGYEISSSEEEEWHRFARYRNEIIGEDSFILQSVVTILNSEAVSAIIGTSYFGKCVVIDPKNGSAPIRIFYNDGKLLVYWDKYMSCTTYDANDPNNHWISDVVRISKAKVESNVY